MTSFFDSVGNAVRDAACAILDVPANAVDLAKKAFGSGAGSPPFNGPRFLQNYFCNKPPNKAFDPPFQGGQCPVKYIVSWIGTSTSNDGASDVTNFSREYWGPILGYKGSTSPNYGSVNLYIITTHGLGAGSYSQAPVESELSRSIYGYQRHKSYTISNFSVVRSDGQADNCGNPVPPPIPPPVNNYNIYNTNITYNDVDNNTYNIPVNIQLGFFQFNLNGELILPVNVNVNNQFQIQPQFNITNNNFTIKLPGSDTTGDNPPDSRPDNKPYDVNPVDEPPIQPPDSGNPKPTKPSPPSKGKVLIGVLVTVTQSPPGNIGQIYQSGGDPNVWFPDLGLVSFQIAVGANAAGWVPDIKVKNRRCYIPCPAEQGAIAVAGTPRTGVTWILTPVYSAKEQEITFPG